MDIREIVTELENERDRVEYALKVLNRHSNGHKPGNLRRHYKRRTRKAVMLPCPDCSTAIPSNAMHKHLMGNVHGWTGSQYRKWRRTENRKSKAAATA